MTNTDAIAKAGDKRPKVPCTGRNELGFRPGVGQHDGPTRPSDIPQQYTHDFRQASYGALFVCSACGLDTRRYHDGSAYAAFTGPEPEWSKWAQRRDTRRTR